MTGYESKKEMARDKLAQEPVTWAGVDFDINTTPPQPAQEREALKLALEVLENLPGFRADIDNAITAIKEALAQPTEKYTYGTPLLDAMIGKEKK